MPIPPRIRDYVAAHSGTIIRFNTAVADCQRLGQQFGSPGRYEWEYRLAHEEEADAALAALAKVEALAANNNVSLDDLYAHCGGRPVKQPWSADAQTWQRAPEATSLGTTHASAS